MPNDSPTVKILTWNLLKFCSN